MDRVGEKEENDLDEGVRSEQGEGRSGQDEVGEEEGRSGGSSFVEEEGELNALLDTIQLAGTSTKVLNGLANILQKYLEAPRLLDPHLEKISGVLMSRAREIVKNGQTVDGDLFRTIYVLTKVRKPGVVVQFFPHEVVDLERTAKFLFKYKAEFYDKHQMPSMVKEEEKAKGEGEGSPGGEREVKSEGGEGGEGGYSWEVAYVLLLWMSIIVLVPFDLRQLDEEGEEKGFLDSLVDVAKNFLVDSGRTKDAAAMLLANLLTRPDAGKQLSEFIDWSTENLENSNNISPLLVTGIHTALVSLLKLGKRTELLEFLPKIQKSLQTPKTTTDRKLQIKIYSRIGITFLKAKAKSTWAYKMEIAGFLGEGVNTQNDVGEEEEDFDDIPEEMEEIIDRLLTGLKDRDTIIRWSSAKGVGRVAAQLPKELADDVVDSIFGLFSESEADSAWHGACLCTAELCRAGLILPEKFPNFFPIIARALVFDVRRGSHSIGQNVRDAACYVCWALARAYSPEVLHRHLPALVPSLLITSLFDREVQCRRAGAAAFQEIVGRLGNTLQEGDTQNSQFSAHGIEIITKADYFSLSNRTESFTNISVFVGKFEEYRYHLITHLLEVKLRHWDKDIRSLSAQGLRNFVALDHKYFLENVIPKFLVWYKSSDVHLRHGSLLALAACVQALTDLSIELSLELQLTLREIIPNMEKSRLFRGKDAQSIRLASLKLLSALFRAKVTTKEEGPATPAPRAGAKKSYTTQFIENLEEGIKYPAQVEEVQKEAVFALSELTLNYYPKPPEALQNRLIRKFIKALPGEQNVAARRGYILSIGSHHKWMYAGGVGEEVIDTLLSQITTIEAQKDSRDPESRRDAVTSLLAITLTLGLDEGVNDGNEGERTVAKVSSEKFNKILEAFLFASRDYSVDNRGDVGSWVRKVAIEGLFALLSLCVAKHPHFFSRQKLHQFLGTLFRQSVEKLDAIRCTCGEIVPKVFEIWRENKNNEIFAALPVLEKVDDILSNIDFSHDDQIFENFTKLLDFSEFRDSVLSGLISTIGAEVVSGNLADNAKAKILNYLKGHPKMVQPVADTLLAIVSRPTRLHVQFLLAAHFFFTEKVFSVNQSERGERSEGGEGGDEGGHVSVEYAKKLSGVVDGIVKKFATNFGIISSAVYVYSDLIHFSVEVEIFGVSGLVSLLAHDFAKIKLYAVEILTKNINNTKTVPNADQISQILSETDWYVLLKSEKIDENTEKS